MTLAIPSRRLLLTPNKGVSWAIRPATLDLDMANSRLASLGNPQSFSAFMASYFTRGSTGWDFLPTDAGDLTSFATNVPRLRGDGLLMEPSSTQSIRNSTFAGASASPSTLPTNYTLFNAIGVSVTIVGIGTEAGMNYIDVRYSGTATASGRVALSPEPGNQIVAASGEVWSGRAFVKAVAGSMTNITEIICNIDENTSGAAFVTNGAGPGVTPDSTRKPVVYTRTLSGGGTVARAQLGFGPRVTAAGAIDLTLRWYQPQFEKLPYSTSPILSSSGTVARSQDILRLTAAQAGVTTSEGALFLRTVPLGWNTVATECLLTLEQSTIGLSRIQFVILPANGRGQIALVDDAGTGVATADSGVSSINVDTTFGITWGGGTARLKVGPGAAVNDASAASPTSVANLAIGARTDGSVPSLARHKRLVAIPRRLTDAEFDEAFARIAA